MPDALWRRFARRIKSVVRPRPPLLESQPRVGRKERAAIRTKIKQLGPWFHNMNLVHGVWTHPESVGAGPDYPGWRWQAIKPLMPDVRDKLCLDLGCSSGFFSLKMKELGARYVLGVDQGEQVQAIEQARFAAVASGLEVEFRSMSAYDVGQLNQQYDVVLFLGVFYHLRHPMLALDSIRKVCRGTLLMQTITTPHALAGRQPCPLSSNADTGLRSPNLNKPDFPLMRFVEGGLDGDTSCWFVPSAEAVLALLRSSGFKPQEMILPTEHEVLISATPDPEN